MNTSVRARHDARGFSMVELLVTIIIAGIAFAAIVPMFVLAEKKSSGETFRNVATQMAQDRLELVRQLDYDQVKDTNLNSDDFPTAGAKLFSPTVYYYGGSASSMTFHVQTRVTLVPTTATLGSEQFKTVTVVAWWGPETDLAKVKPPVKPTKLQTQVYKQYAGPQVLTFTAAELVSKSEYGADQFWITAMPLTLEATIAEIDRPETAKVHFSIRDASSEVAFMDVETTTSPGTYTWVYDPDTMNDGLYTVSAQARSTKNFSGNLLSLPVTVEQGPPPMPLNVHPRSGGSAATGGMSVSLTWDASEAADFDHFEVYRSGPNSAGNYTKRGTSVGPTYFDGPDASFKVDETYYYIVYALDEMGTRLQAQGIEYRSPPSDPATAVMAESTDKNSPPVPAWVGAPFSSSGLSATLVWTKVIDAAPPSDPTQYVSGNKEFIVTRQSRMLGSGTWGGEIQLTPIAFDPDALVLNQTVTDSSVTYGWEYRYEVLATDLAGNSSAIAAWTTVAVPVPTRTLIVKNSQWSQLRYVYVTSTDNLTYYDTAGDPVASATLAKVTLAKKYGEATWTLTDGDYTVHYSTSATTPFPEGNVKLAPKGTPSVTVP